MKKSANIFEIGYKTDDGLFSVYEKDHQSYTDQFGNFDTPGKNGKWYAKIEIPNFPHLTTTISFEQVNYILQCLHGENKDKTQTQENDLEIFEIGYKNDDGFFSVYEKDNQSYTDQFGNLDTPGKNGKWYANVAIPNFPYITINLPFEHATYLLQRLPGGYEYKLQNSKQTEEKMKEEQKANTITVIYPESRSDFAFKYSNQILPQPGGIEIDPEERTLGVFVNSEINSFENFNGRKFWIPLADPMIVSVTSMSRLLDEIKDDAQTVCDGYECNWDGNKWRGELSDFAQNVLDSIESYVQSTCFEMDIEIENMFQEDPRRYLSQFLDDDEIEKIKDIAADLDECKDLKGSPLEHVSSEYFDDNKKITENTLYFLFLKELNPVKESFFLGEADDENIEKLKNICDNLEKWHDQNKKNEIILENNNQQSSMRNC